MMKPLSVLIALLLGAINLTACDSKPPQPEVLTQEVIEEETSQPEVVQAPDNSEEYRRWRDDMVVLRSRLRSAPSTNNLGEWGDFAREFRAELDAASKRPANIQPWAARSVMHTSLIGIRNMFQATAFDNQKDFDEASAYYEKGLKELKRLIDGDDPAQIIRDSES